MLCLKNNGWGVANRQSSGLLEIGKNNAQMQGNGICEHMNFKNFPCGAGA